MGNWLCRTKKLRILILGLDSVGKTTTLYHMKLGEVIYPSSTIGFNVETVPLDGVALTVWDVGSRDKVRPLWRHYYPNTHGFVFMIDSTDRWRLDEAIDELINNVLQSEEVIDVVVMILANKQDLEGALSAQEIEDALLKRYPSIKSCIQTVFVKPFSALDRNQVIEAFSYFVHLLSLRQAGTNKHGLITLKEQELQSSKAESELSVKLILKNSVQYLQTFFK